ncbi:MAG: methyltransferase domain-containing protein [Calditrichia bacterium]
MPFTSQSMERFDNLYQYLSRKFQLRQKAVQVGETVYQLFTVKDIDELLDRLIEQPPDHPEVKDERLPYWAEIWPSSIALARFLSQKNLIESEARIIEIGCGIGLVGMAVANTSSHILLTDYQPDALLFAELNWLMNLGRSPTLQLLDWRNPAMEERFDVVLASDVIYEKRFFHPLIHTFESLLLPEGHVYLSEPNRPVAHNFFDLLHPAGFDFKKYEVETTYEDKALQISVYDIWKIRK